MANEISYAMSRHLSRFPLWFGRVKILPGYKVAYPRGVELYCVGLSREDTEAWCQAFDDLPALYRDEGSAEVLRGSQ